jgi:hypothetical protein
MLMPWRVVCEVWYFRICDHDNEQLLGCGGVLPVQPKIKFSTFDLKLAQCGKLLSANVQRVSKFDSQNPKCYTENTLD